MFGVGPVLVRITIGSGGLTAAPAIGAIGSAGDVVEMPLGLSASQTWHVDGRSGGQLGENGLLLAGDLTGSSSALTVELSNGPLLFLAENDIEVGPVAIDGANTSKVAANGVVSLLGAKLNSSDGEAVGLSHVFFAGSGSVGPLTTSDADLDVGSPAEAIEVTSARLDSACYVEFNVSGEGTSARTDYSQLVSHGPIELASSKVEVVVRPASQGASCPSLVPGQTYTFVSTTGTLSGSFSNAPEHGAEVSIRFAQACPQKSQKIRIAYHESGPTQTVTGTVEEAAAKKQREEEAAARLVRMSLRRPSSASTRRTYFRRVSGAIPRSRPTWAIGRPDSNTSRVARSSSSSGYFLALAMTEDFSFRQANPGIEVSVKQ
jgi:hypothetical protein